MTTVPVRPVPPSEAAEPARLVNARRFLMGITTSHSADVLPLLAPDVVYTVPGHSPLAGVFHGPAQVEAHIRQLFDATSGTFDVLKTVDWLVGLTNVAVIQYAQAQAGGVIYRNHHLFVFETDRHDLLSNIWLFFEDPDDADRLLGKVPRTWRSHPQHSPLPGEVSSPDPST
jgi:ketosteroid isomerase-like protein